MSVGEGTAVGVAPDWEAADATGDWRGSAESVSDIKKYESVQQSFGAHRSPDQHAELKPEIRSEAEKSLSICD